MRGRRRFLGGLLAAGALPATGWAELGSPEFLAAARRASGDYALYGLSGAGAALFQLPLPGRGHAAAAHPSRTLAVAFARRPGRFALVIDCQSGKSLAELSAPEGRHFSGHGAFSRDGDLLFTGENAYDEGRGMIGVWDMRDGLRRVAEFASGGVGPHDLRLMPDGASLVVANGGIETHPDAGRAKLNLATMRPNLSYLSLSGDLLEQHEPPAEWHQLSTRHLALRPDGLVALACQWQGDMADVPPLLVLHRRGEALQFCEADEDRMTERRMRGYAGSVAIAAAGEEIAITGPRGGLALVFDTSGRRVAEITEPDICGTAAGRQGLVFSTGTGRVIGAAATARPVSHPVNWDNHLVAIAPV